MTLGPGADQRGVAHPHGDAREIGAVELVIPQAIQVRTTRLPMPVSAFSFTVTTQGNPVRKITEKGTLPKHLTSFPESSPS